VEVSPIDRAAFATFLLETNVSGSNKVAGNGVLRQAPGGTAVHLSVSLHRAVRRSLLVTQAGFVAIALWAVFDIFFMSSVHNLTFAIPHTGSGALVPLGLILAMLATSFVAMAAQTRRNAEQLVGLLCIQLEATRRN
jgi:hypothetical protein